MTFFQELTSNQTLMTGVTGWVVAQVLKTILDIGLNHSFNPERLVGVTGKIEGIRGAYADTGGSRRDFRHFDCIYSRSDVHITNIGSFHFG